MSIATVIVTHWKGTTTQNKAASDKMFQMGIKPLLGQQYSYASN